mmetsp:Transcript_28032/g.46426  ORF Transcript_28032/g.46426 Transcript_28032/m.46426 type:complete len:93 (+) Transcript_28032:171-449(+)
MYNSSHERVHIIGYGLVTILQKQDRAFRRDLATNEIDFKGVKVYGSRLNRAKLDALLGQLTLLSLKKDYTGGTVSDGSGDDFSKAGDEFVII